MLNSESAMLGKTLVLILGACAAGKSTLTRALCGEGGVERSVELDCFDRKRGVHTKKCAKFVVGTKGVAIAGNWKNTSDSISRPEALEKVIDICLGLAPTVVVDSFRPSNKFVDWMQQHPAITLATFVYLDITVDTNGARMLGRRVANGRIETRLPDQTYKTLLRTRDRAKVVWEYAQHNYLRESRTFVTVTDHLKPDPAAALIRNEIDNYGRQHL